MPTNFPTGLDSYVNPTINTKLNEPGFLHHEQHGNINDAVEQIQQKIGINVSSIKTSLDFSRYLYLLTETQHYNGTYKEIVGNPFPTNIIWYVNSGKAIKLVEKQYTYGPETKKFITQIVYLLYDGTVGNNILRTITDSITLSNGGNGPFEESRSRVIA
jgi:hypothetical protein